MNESIEHIPSGREILKNLEAEGKYVFHGSTNPAIPLTYSNLGKHTPKRMVKKCRMISLPSTHHHFVISQS